MADKNLEDITPDEIEGLLIQGIADKNLEFAGMKDGEIAVSLTEQGEGHIHELLGGIDVVEVTHVIYNLFVKHGVLGFKVEANFINFTIIAQAMSIVKHYKNWDAIVEVTKKEATNEQKD